MFISSPLPARKARIEIIPLIDIMFFLLASFMMVSLSQTHMKGIKVVFPLAPPRNFAPEDFVSVKVGAGNVYYVDGKFVSADDLRGYLYRLHESNPDAKVSISGEALAAHGDVIRVLDFVRAARFQHVGYQVRAASAPGPH